MASKVGTSTLLTDESQLSATLLWMPKRLVLIPSRLHGSCEPEVVFCLLKTELKEDANLPEKSR